jgi:hypothetical protein
VAGLQDVLFHLSGNGEPLAFLSIDVRHTL